MIGVPGPSPPDCGVLQRGAHVWDVASEYSGLCLAEQQKILWAFERSRHLGSNFRKSTSKGLMRVLNLCILKKCHVTLMPSWCLAHKRYPRVFGDCGHSGAACLWKETRGPPGGELGDVGKEWHFYISFCTDWTLT